jgi:lysozyme
VRRLAVIVVALAACGQPDTPGHPGIAWAPESDRQGALTVCASGATLEGVDVSHWEGTIDWSKVAASGRAFAIAKATEDINFADPQFQANWAGMKSAGLTRGAYHFFRPASDGAAQADWFLDKVGAFNTGDLPPILDWEATDSVAATTAQQRVSDFVGRIKDRTGLTTMVYTSARFLGTVGNPTQFQMLPLWDAHWNVTCPNIPDAWQRWTMWQYSSTAAVPGITGNVDVNRFNGSAEDLKTLTVPEPSDAGVPAAGQPEPDAGPPPVTQRPAGGCATEAPGLLAVALGLFVARRLFRPRTVG